MAFDESVSRMPRQTDRRLAAFRVSYLYEILLYLVTFTVYHYNAHRTGLLVFELGSGAGLSTCPAKRLFHAADSGVEIVDHIIGLNRVPALRCKESTEALLRRQVIGYSVIVEFAVTAIHHDAVQN